MKQNEMNSQKAQELTKEELVTVQFATNINNVLIYNKKMRNCFNTVPHFYIPL